MPDPTPKPYDIKQRVFVYACEVVRASPKRRTDVAAFKVWAQLVAAATSVGAHLEEAAAAGSRAHFLSLTRGGLREMRESRYWLRILNETKLEGFKATESLLKESDELVAILTTIVRKTAENGAKAARR